MSNFLPDGDPPGVSPAWRHLLREPCATCGGTRLFPQTLHQRDDHLTPELKLYRTNLLCGDCGAVFERRDPDDYWDHIRERLTSK